MDMQLKLAMCRNRGWWCVEDPVTKQWKPCDPDTPGAREDLNRWRSWRMTGSDEGYVEMSTRQAKRRS